MDFSYAPPELTRLRCSAYRHLGHAGITMRVIKRHIPSIAELHLPPVIGEIAQSQRGLTPRHWCEHAPPTPRPASAHPQLDC